LSPHGEGRLQNHESQSLSCRPMTFRVSRSHFTSPLFFPTVSTFCSHPTTTFPGSSPTHESDFTLTTLMRMFFCTIFPFSTPSAWAHARMNWTAARGARSGPPSPLITNRLLVTNMTLQVRRIAKGQDVTSVKLVILDESQYKVTFQHRNLTLTWCRAPASPTPIVYWTESNPHSPSNNNSFYLDFIREAGSVKVRMYITDSLTGGSYVLAVRSNADASGKASAAFVSFKDNTGTLFSVEGSQAYADFDLSSVLTPGTAPNPNDKTAFAYLK
jgi:hypothetical protein